jgi:hypothetical protein
MLQMAPEYGVRSAPVGFSGTGLLPYLYAVAVSSARKSADGRVATGRLGGEKNVLNKTDKNAHSELPTATSYRGVATGWQ